MSQNLGSIYAELALRMDRFDKSLKEAQSRIVVASQMVDRKTREMSSSFDRVGKTVGSMVTTAARWGSAMAAVAAVATAGIGVKFNADMERARIGFETMLGSAEKAGTFLRELQQFAAKTPFEFPELRDAASKMLAFGFAAKDVIPTLTAVGDAAAGLGVGAEGANRIILALGQMRAKAKVSAEEMMQLTEAGVPAWDILAKAMGKSTGEVMKLTEQGLIPADQAIQMLVTGMEERFPGMMDKQSKAFSGLISTLRDSAVMLAGTVLQPLFNRLKDLLPVVIDLTDRFRKGFEVGSWQLAIANIAPSWVRPRLAELYRTIDQVQEGVKRAAEAIRQSGFGSALESIGKWANDLRGKLAAQDWEGVGRTLGEGLLQALSAIGDFGVRLSSWLFNQLEQIDWSRAGGIILGALVEVVSGAFDALFSLDWWKKHWEAALGVVGLAFGEALFAKLLKPLAELPLLFRRIPLAGKLGEELARIVTEAVAKALKFLGNLFADMGSTFIEGLLRGLRTKGVRLLPELRGLVKAAIDKLVDFGETLYLHGLEFMSQLGRGIGSKMAAVRDAGVRVVNWLVKGIGEFIKDFVGVGTDIVRGLWEGILGAGAWLLQKVQSFLSDYLVVPIKKFLKISSPSEFMAEIGRNVSRGLSNGIRDTAGEVANAVTQVAASVAQVAEGIKDKVAKVMDGLSLSAQVLQAQWELQQREMAATAVEADKLNAQLSYEQKQLALTQERINLLTSAYQQMKELKGENAEETQKLLLELLKEKAAYIDITKTIEDLQKKQRDLIVQQAIASTGRGLPNSESGRYAAYVNQQVASGGTISESGFQEFNKAYEEKVREIARRQGVDLSTAEAMARANDQASAEGKVPQYAGGGLARYTGLAMLHGTPRRPELVLNNSQAGQLLQLLQRPNIGGGASAGPTAGVIGDAVYRAVRDALSSMRSGGGTQPVILALDPLGLKRLGQALVPVLNAEKVRLGEA